MTVDEQYALVPDSQVRFHRFWEAASVFAQVPFMAYLGTRRSLPTWARVGCWGIAGLALYVDGGLLLRWAKHDKEQQT